MILKALRSTGCIASHDLADGIETNLMMIDDQGQLVRCVPAGVTVPVKPSLTVVQGSGRKQ